MFFKKASTVAKVEAKIIPKAEEELKVLEPPEPEYEGYEEPKETESMEDLVEEATEELSQSTPLPVQQRMPISSIKQEVVRDDIDYELAELEERKHTILEARRKKEEEVARKAKEEALKLQSTQPQISEDIILSALQNHETRLEKIESYLFRKVV